MVGDVNFLVENAHTITRNREAESVTSKKVFLEVNAEKTKCPYESCEQNAEQNRNIKMGSRECLDSNIKDYNLSVVLNGFETWSLVSMDKHRRKGFENRVTRKYLCPRGRKQQETAENCIMRSFTVCAPN